MTVGINAYITTAEYEAYADLRGIAPNFATLDADVILSADFINLYYTLKDGYALPTTDADKIAAMSKAALKACELQQIGRLTLNTATMVSAEITSESKTLEGVGGKSVTYAEGTAVTFKPRVPELDILMRPFVQSGGAMLKRG